MSQFPKYHADDALVKSVFIFATPSLASVFRSGSLLEDLLRASYKGRRSHGKSLTVVARCVHAVVDAIPSQGPIPGSTNRILHGPENSEGLAILLASDDARLRSSFDSGAAQDEPLDDSPKTMTFTSPWSPRDSGTSKPGEIQTMRQISLPVANTIFVNGQRTTFFQDDWKVKLSPTEEPKITFDRRKPLREFRARLWCHLSDFVDSGSVPLEQLTKPRKVVSSMGNVLAQIEIDGQATPASQELERAIASYIESNPTSNIKGPLLVYALIRPESTTSSKDTCKEDKPSSPLTVLESLWQGAKLFKVTGGGGGWGKRQGLLSLEPAVGFENQETQSTIEMPDLDDDAQAMPELGSRSIVSTSGTAEFLVHSPKLAAMDSPADPDQAPISDSFWQNPTTVVLGTAADPNSQDDLVKASEVSGDVRFVPNHFGVISYGGAGLASTLREQGTRVSPLKGVQTRLDVPDSRFVFRTGS